MPMEVYGIQHGRRDRAHRREQRRTLSGRTQVGEPHVQYRSTLQWLRQVGQ
jgi:hypothetical protein